MGNHRTFALFFMVLDLRLVKIGCRETINFFLLSAVIVFDGGFPIVPFSFPSCINELAEFIYHTKYFRNFVISGMVDFVELQFYEFATIIFSHRNHKQNSSSLRCLQQIWKSLQNSIRNPFASGAIRKCVPCGTT